MNLLLFTGQEHKDSGLTIPSGDPRYKHITTVLNAGVGDSLQVGLINGRTGVAKIKRLDDDKITLDAKLLNAPPKPSMIRLILALPRPKVLGRTIRTITELGVKHIDLVQAARVEKSYWTAHQLDEEYLNRRVLEALSQTRDTVFPKITYNPQFRPFVEDILAPTVAEYDSWVAHPYTEQKLPMQFKRPSIVAVGPEGGWVDFEIDLFKKLGFQIGHTGPRTLSTGVFISTLLARGLSICP